MPQDAGGFVAPGGTGESTLMLYECVHIILGRDLYGKAIARKGATLYVAAEDSREAVLGRLNWICRTMRWVWVVIPTTLYYSAGAPVYRPNSNRDA